MEISAIGAGSGTTATAQRRGLDALKSEDFFKILVTELQNQDPFEPSDSSDIIGQVSQIRTIEQSSKLTETLDLLTQQQSVGAGSDLIGKYVQAVATAADGSQTLHEGVVTSVFFNSDGSAVLELDTGEAVLATDVVRVTTLDVLAATAAATEDDSQQDEEST
jgi:flagellar basal-body rod modification protein FlgD